MRSRIGAPKDEIPCLLEVVKSLRCEGKPAGLEDLATELGRSRDEVKRIVKEATDKGLLKRDGNFLTVTEKGNEEIRRHREKYIHDKYAHRKGFLGTISRFFEGKVRNWRDHWRNRHGMNGKAIDEFYKSVQDFRGRVEETVPLTSLAEGEKAVVAYTIGGHGMIRRLAEMGLTPGTRVKILRHGLMSGPVQIEVRGVCLALGHGVASRIFVKPLR